MFGLGLPEILIILVLFLVLFGAKKLPQIGEGLGKTVKELRKIKEERKADKAQQGKGNLLSDLKKELTGYNKIKTKVAEVEDWRVSAVWPEHLLLLSDNAINPGKEMLVQQLSLDSRSASATIKKMLATRWDIGDEFVAKLGELTGPDGQRLYRATQGGWRTLNLRDSKFKGSVDVQVDLLDLKKHLETQDQRAKERRKELVQ